MRKFEPLRRKTNEKRHQSNGTGIFGEENGFDEQGLPVKFYGADMIDMKDTKYTQEREGTDVR